MVAKHPAESCIVGVEVAKKEPVAWPYWPDGATPCGAPPGRCVNV